MGRAVGRLRAVAVTALLAALAGCGNSSTPDIPTAVAAADVVASTGPDANGFTDVPYPDYAEAAFQTGIAPDVVAPQDGFSDGLRDLCDDTPADFSARVARMRADVAGEDDPMTALTQRFDEVDLRVALACRGRMSDWLGARGELDRTDETAPNVSPSADAAMWDDDGYSDGGAGPEDSTGGVDGSGDATSEPDASPSPTSDDEAQYHDDAQYHGTDAW